MVTQLSRIEHRLRNPHLYLGKKPRSAKPKRGGYSTRRLRAMSRPTVRRTENQSFTKWFTSSSGGRVYCEQESAVVAASRAAGVDEWCVLELTIHRE
jgi:hypothetical protein